MPRRIDQIELHTFPKHGSTGRPHRDTPSPFHRQRVGAGGAVIHAPCGADGSGQIQNLLRQRGFPASAWATMPKFSFFLCIGVSIPAGLSILLPFNRLRFSAPVWLLRLL